MATELFTDQATATVLTGGSTAPAAGTSETWTVSSAAGFPAAVTGVSQFHVSDPAVPGEDVTVTNTAGTTWTVTRGTGSNGVTAAHANPFTVRLVIPASFLSSVVVGLLPSGGDDTANIKGMIALTGRCLLAPGAFTYSATLNPLALDGPGEGLCTLTMAAGFTFDSSGAGIKLTAPQARVSGFTHIGGPSTSYASNPAGNAVALMDGAQYADIRCRFLYTNGNDVIWASAGTGTIIGSRIETSRFQCKAGISLTGHTAQSFAGQVEIVARQAGQIAGDAIALTDIRDVDITGYENVSVVPGASAAALRIAGACSSIQALTADLGQFGGAGTANWPTVLIEDSPNGGPVGVTIDGIIQAGGPTGNVVIRNPNGFAITDIHVRARMSGGQGHGATVSATLGSGIEFTGAAFSGNGAGAAGTNYDLNWSGAATGKVFDTRFESAVVAVSSPGIQNPVNIASNQNVPFENCAFAGTGTTLANSFTALPVSVRNCKNVNPHGLKAVTVPASGSSVAALQYDATYYIVGAGGVTPAPAGFLPANPTATSATTSTLMGLGSTAQYTPTGSGVLRILMTAALTNATATTSITPAARYGVVAGPSTTVAAASNGGTISGIASWSSPSAGVLAVASTTGYATSGTIWVATSTTPAQVTYTGIAGNTFTGCAYAQGSTSGTVSTGGTVTGYPPNGAVGAGVGTRFGSTSDIPYKPPGVGQYTAVSFPDVLTLTPGTTYWFDAGLATGNAADAASAVNVSVTIQEQAAAGGCTVVRSVGSTGGGAGPTVTIPAGQCVPVLVSAGSFLTFTYAAGQAPSMVTDGN